MIQSQVPFNLKIAYSLFMLVLVPFYWITYGPSNFLYFCDIALFITWIGIWKESPTLISVAAVGILLPQLVWVLDFIATAAGFPLLGLTEYMFRESISLFARGLSLFHGWLPFLLIFLLGRLGYRKNAILYWTAIAWVAILISYFFMPAPGDAVESANVPVNINYVYGFSETTKQSWVSDPVYLVGLMLILPLAVYWPTGKLIERWVPVNQISTDQR